MTTRRKKAAEPEGGEAVAAAVAVAEPVAVTPLRLVLRCHQERDTLTEIEVTAEDLRTGVDVPAYTRRIEVVTL